MLRVACRVANDGLEPLGSGGPHPVHVAARWFADDGTMVLDGPRTQLPQTLAPGSSTDVVVLVHTPWNDGRYVLRIAPVQENVRWFDDADPGNGARAEVQVRLLPT